MSGAAKKNLGWFQHFGASYKRGTFSDSGKIPEIFVKATTENHDFPLYPLWVGSEWFLGGIRSDFCSWAALGFFFRIFSVLVQCWRGFWVKMSDAHMNDEIHNVSWSALNRGTSWLNGSRRHSQSTNMLFFVDTSGIRIHNSCSVISMSPPFTSGRNFIPPSERVEVQNRKVSCLALSFWLLFERANFVFSRPHR